jgi:hypothetical protein
MQHNNIPAHYVAKKHKHHKKITKKKKKTFFIYEWSIITIVWCAIATIIIAFRGFQKNARWLWNAHKNGNALYGNSQMACVQFK